MENSVKSKLNQNFSALNHRRCCKEPVLEFEVVCIEEEEEEEEEEEQDVSAQILQKHKYQRFDLQYHLQRSSSLWLQQRKIQH